MAKLTPGTSETSTSQDRDVIPKLNYDELEKKYQIRKHYPRFIHNIDYSTPQIKRMISDKPIYSKANCSKSKSTLKLKLKSKSKSQSDSDSKTVIQMRTKDFDAITGEMINYGSIIRGTKLMGRTLRKESNREHLQDQRSLNPDHREHHQERLDVRDSVRDQQVQDRSDEKEETRRLLRQHLDQRKKSTSNNAPFKAKSLPQVQVQIQTQAKQHASRPDAPSLVYENIFESTQSTLVVGSSNQGSAVTINKSNISKQDIFFPKKSSISGKLKDLVLNKRPVQILGTATNRTKSFDQTKSEMTIERDYKNNISRLAENSGRRASEVLRTCDFFFLFFRCFFFFYFELID